MLEQRHRHEPSILHEALRIIAADPLAAKHTELVVEFDQLHGRFEDVMADTERLTALLAECEKFLSQPNMLFVLGKPVDDLLACIDGETVFARKS